MLYVRKPHHHKNNVFPVRIIQNPVPNNLLPPPFPCFICWKEWKTNGGVWRGPKPGPQPTFVRSSHPRPQFQKREKLSFVGGGVTLCEGHLCTLVQRCRTTQPACCSITGRKKIPGPHGLVHGFAVAFFDRDPFPRLGSVACKVGLGREAFFPQMRQLCPRILCAQACWSSTSTDSTSIWSNGALFSLSCSRDKKYTSAYTSFHIMHRLDSNFAVTP